jgi:hypothetical protein
MEFQYRHGDVFLRAVAAIPDDAKPVEPDRGRTVLAYGEVTGHAHAFAPGSRVALFREDGAGGGLRGASFLRVEGDRSGFVAGEVARTELGVVVKTSGGEIRFAVDHVDVKEGGVLPKTPWSALQHEEHHTEAIPAGTYALPPQQEYTPEEIRAVAD